MTKPRRTGLTGNIGSGKSTVAQLLVAKGAALIDSDALARAATQDPEVLAQISEQLGAELVKDGALDRAKTAELVFNDASARQTLNGIVHPWVRRESEARALALTQQADPPPVILMDIPLLYENGLETSLDAVIVVDAPLDTRVQRVMKRSRLSEREARARDAAQMPLGDKVAKADFVLHNSGDLEGLGQQVDKLWVILSE